MRRASLGRAYRLAVRTAHRVPCGAPQVYRLIVISYFILLPSYFWYRWLYTIEWDVPYRMYYQTTVCVAEMFGAICVMMLAVTR